MNHLKIKEKTNSMDKLKLIRTYVKSIKCNRNFIVEKHEETQHGFFFSYKYETAKGNYNRVAIALSLSSMSHDSLASILDILKHSLSWKRAFS